LSAWHDWYITVAPVVVATTAASWSLLFARRQERRSEARSKRVVEQLRREVSLHFASGQTVVGDFPESTDLFQLALEPDERKILARTKQGVALDLAQLCSATALPPSRVRDAVKRLESLDLLASEHDTHKPSTEIRYRKQVADSVGGAAE